MARRSPGLEKKVMDVLRARPGASVRQVISQVGAGTGSVVAAIASLESEGQIVRVREGNRARLFMTNDHRIQDVLRDDAAVVTRLKIVIGKHPEASQAKIARMLGVSRQLVNYHVRRLIRRREIVRHVWGKHTVYLLKGQK